MSKPSVYKSPGFPTSAKNRLNSTYTTVQSNSSVWGTGGTDLTEIAAASGDWNSTFTTVQSNSSVWDSTTDINYLSGQIAAIDVPDISLIQSTSGDWNSTHTTVQSNSSVWGTGGADLTEIAAASGDWNSTHTTVQSNSSIWDSTTDINYLSGQIDLTNSDVDYLSGQIAAIDIPDISLIQTTSGNWDSTYTTVQSNSSTWGTGGTDLTEIAAASGNWNSTFTTVQSNSSVWGTGGVTGNWVEITGDTMTGGLSAPSLSTTDIFTTDWHYFSTTWRLGVSGDSFLVQKSDGLNWISKGEFS